MEKPKRSKHGVKVPERLLAGVYANQMVVRHTREEFLVDFINGFPPQSVVTARVIVSPGHLKRMIRALKDSLQRYQMMRGTAIADDGPPAEGRRAETPPVPEAAAEQPGAEQPEAGEGKKRQMACKLPEFLAPGVYANQMMIGHSRDEFLLDFISMFGPQGVVTARVFVGPHLIQRMIRAFRENLSRYEAKFGMIIEATLPQGDYQLN